MVFQKRVKIQYKRGDEVNKMIMCLLFQDESSENLQASSLFHRLEVEPVHEEVACSRPRHPQDCQLEGVAGNGRRVSDGTIANLLTVLVQETT